MAVDPFLCLRAVTPCSFGRRRTNVKTADKTAANNSVAPPYCAWFCLAHNARQEA
jgi:hypothetical protein